MSDELYTIYQHIISAGSCNDEIPDILAALHGLYRIAEAQQENIARLQKQVAVLQAATPSGAVRE